MRVLICGMTLGASLFLLGGIAVTPAYPADHSRPAELAPGVLTWYCTHTPNCTSR